ncbi:MAG: phosphoglucosamine mutase [Desulfococcaceae bacterium]
MGRLFGTDGIRGVANQHPMTPETALRAGRAVSMVFGTKGRIVIGKDTRISGNMLEYALASGICSAGGNAYLAGVLPTPGIAFLSQAEKADAGIVISASHNPFYDNGIKIFKGDGFKLPDEKEAEIEELLLDEKLAEKCGHIRETGQVFQVENAGDRYAQFLKNTLPPGFSLKGMKIVLDCSNGATYQVAPKVFAELGADIQSLFVLPDGKNINAHCGSQHTESLKSQVHAWGADIGLAFDGDGDRLIAVDEKGNIITGDKILVICAKYMKKKGLLKNNLAVTTVMSNIGLHIALKKMEIDHRITDVGDRYVMQEMLASGAVLGGEDSGHMIFLNYHSTGDGILTALRLIEAMMDAARPLSELAKIMDVYPQLLVNVEVLEKPDIETHPRISAVIRNAEKALGEKGRVLVRYSGTQPLCRIMAEGPTEEEIRHYCEEIAAVVKAEIGK